MSTMRELMGIKRDAWPWVVVADDDGQVRKLCDDVLRAEGYHVILVENGLLALQALTTADRPCVLLLDLMMPQVDGYAVYAAMEADPVLRNGHHIVIFSAHRRDWQDFPSADAVLDKPFNVDDLVDTVARVAHQVVAH
jgi:CheY-like chemotaxis protein